MIRLFILALQVVRMIGRALERRGEREDAIRQVEAELGQVASEMADKATAARDNVSLDPDSLRDDPRNIDRFPVERDHEKRD